jgi:hypothetical protein
MIRILLTVTVTVNLSLRNTRMWTDSTTPAHHTYGLDHYRLPVTYHHRAGDGTRRVVSLGVVFNK